MKYLILILSVLSLSIFGSEISSAKQLVVKYSITQNVYACNVEGKSYNIIDRSLHVSQVVTLYGQDSGLFYVGFIQGKSYYVLSLKKQLAFERLSLNKKELIIN